MNIRYKKILSYSGIHSWIHRSLPKTNFCSNDKSHKAKRFEWANISGKYLRHPNDYKRLCPSCHRKFDYTERQRSFRRKYMRGNTYKRKGIEQFDKKEKFIKKYTAILFATKELNLAKGSISNNLAGRSRSAGGFIWKYA